MKKLLVIMLSAMMVFAMCACGAKEEEPDAGLPNPVTECTQEELLETTGFDLVAPEGAEDVAYSYISAEGEETIAQMIFTVDGKEYCYRAQPTAVTSIMSGIDEKGEVITAESIQDALESGINIGAALSGMNYEWKACATVDVQHCEGICAFNEGKAGFISWLDVVPGILYSLSMDDGCAQDNLMNLAEAIFVPVQGDAE